MELKEAIDKRSSCHSYLNKNVDMKDIQKVLDAGLKAPNSGNLQILRFVVVQDENKRQMLADASKQKWLNEAPVIIAVLSDLEAAKSFYEEKSEIYCTQGAGAAIENMLLMATDLGLGSCWVSVFDKNKVRIALKLESNLKTEGLITIGYSAQKDKKAKRFSLESSVSFNEWKGKKILSMFPFKDKLQSKFKKK